MGFLWGPGRPDHPPDTSICLRLFLVFSASPVGFTGNLSLLEMLFFVFFSRGRKAKWKDGHSVSIRIARIWFRLGSGPKAPEAVHPLPVLGLELLGDAGASSVGKSALPLKQ